MYSAWSTAQDLQCPCSHCLVQNEYTIYTVNHVDDLIKKLRSSGYGLHIRSLFVGCILYADDIVGWAY